MFQRFFVPRQAGAPSSCRVRKASLLIRQTASTGRAHDRSLSRGRRHSLKVSVMPPCVVQGIRPASGYRLAENALASDHHGPADGEGRAVSCCCVEQADKGLVAHRRDGFRCQATGAPDGPFLVPLEQDGAGGTPLGKRDKPFRRRAAARSWRRSPCPRRCRRKRQRPRAGAAPRSSPTPRGGRQPARPRHG